MDSQQLSVIMAESRKKEIIQRERQISLINEEIDKKRRLKSEDKKYGLRVSSGQLCPVL